MKRYFDTKHSFSARCSIIIIAIVAFIFLADFSISYYYSNKTIEKAAIEKAELTLKNSASSIENIFSTVSKSVDNIRDISTQSNISNDSLYAVVKYFVSRNENIMGSAIAFEPNYFPEKGYYFSPYAYKKNGKIYTKQLGTDSYDYFSMDWYKVPKESGKSYWTSPYFDEGGGGELMTTYSSLLTDAQGKLKGIVTADVSLNWLNKLVQTTKTYDNSYCFMLDTKGVYIVHQNEDSICNENIFNKAKHEPNPQEIESLGRKMLNGESGYITTTKEGKAVYVFYRPVTQTGWSIAIVCPADEIFKDLNRVSHRIFLFIFIGLFMIFATCRIIIRHISKPIEAFANSAEEIAKGNFNAKLPTIQTKDEMKALHDSFEYMQHEIQHYIESLEDTISAKEKIESELRIARNIQLGMIPKIFPAFPERQDLDLYASLRPAKEVGGDLYDFFIHEEKLYFTVGDVSGKGIPASLLMAVTRSLFRSVASTLEDPKQIIESMNHAIAETNEENMFVTIFVGILDLATGKITFCNAGHNPPCIITKEGAVSFMELKQNLPIGIFSDFQYETQELQLNEGETIFLYTDGLNEAENSDKELYGNDRLLDVLLGKQNVDSKKLVTTMFESVENHANQAPQSDDLTMLAVKFIGAQAQKENPVSHLGIRNQIAELTKVNAFIDQICEENGLNAALNMSLNLAMEEVISNVIFYAYPKGENNHVIELFFSKQDNLLTFIVQDEGVYFDPTQKKDADITLSAEERQIGGLGIYLVKQIMNTVEYKREGELNILTMTKEL